MRWTRWVLGIGCITAVQLNGTHIPFQAGNANGRLSQLFHQFLKPFIWYLPKRVFIDGRNLMYARYGLPVYINCVGGIYRVFTVDSKMQRGHKS